MLSSRNSSRASFFLTIILFIGQAFQTEITNTAGFINHKITYTAGGYAVCISGHVEVNATTHENQKFLFDNPIDQYAATASMVEFVREDSYPSARIRGGPTTVSGTFKIEARMCFPRNGLLCSDTIQFLIHGIGFSQAYWDFAKDYSYIDVAAKAGYPTFSYDRLGVGGSDHPDPIQVVQAPLQVEIAHSLVSSVREGKFGGRKFRNVVGVGHSFGSIQAVGVLARYPTAFDAVVLTGFSLNTTGIPTTFADFNSAIANQSQRGRFANLPSGYLVSGSAISNQFAFFHYPDFDPKIFQADEASKQTYTFGEIFTLGSVIAGCTAFKGPINTVLGEFDWIFALGNAHVPTDLAAEVQPALFPNASNGSQSYIVPDAGHATNLHFTAGLQFDQIQRFVKDNGF